MRLISTLAIGTSVVLVSISAAVPLTPAEDQQRSDERAEEPRFHFPRSGQWFEWNDYRRFAREIEKLPGWPAERDLTREEWSSLARVAGRMQELADADFEKVLVAYMVSNRAREHGAKAMLLLRVMFEVEDALPGVDDVHPCGGFTFISTMPPDAVPTVAWPVKWDGRRPTLVAYRQDHSLSRSPPYDVLGEYRAFRASFSHRAGLDQLADEPHTQESSGISAP